MVYSIYKLQNRIFIVFFIHTPDQVVAVYGPTSQLPTAKKRNVPKKKKNSLLVSQFNIYSNFPQHTRSPAFQVLHHQFLIGEVSQETYGATRCNNTYLFYLIIELLLLFAIMQRFSLCTCEFFGNPSISKCVLCWLKIQETLRGTLVSWLLGREQVAQIQLFEATFVQWISVDLFANNLFTCHNVFFHIELQFLNV